jgi:hypothetical protein
LFVDLEHDFLMGVDLILKAGDLTGVVGENLDTDFDGLFKGRCPKTIPTVKPSLTRLATTSSDLFCHQSPKMCEPKPLTIPQKIWYTKTIAKGSLIT